MTKQLIGAFLALMLAACASFGVPTPQTLDQRLAVAQTSVTEARTMAGVLLDARKISSADAQNLQTQADTAKVGFDIARSMLGTDPAAANSKMLQTQALLTALQAYLNERESAK